MADKEDDFIDEYPPPADIARQREILGVTEQDDGLKLGKEVGVVAGSC